jgi:hypothetical protein
MTRRRTQTVRIKGQRVKITTSAEGKATVAAALPLECECQAAQVQRLRAMPGYGSQFLLAGDQNAAKRGPKAQVQAKATGMEPGEPDLRIYLSGGRLRMIENKVGKGKLSPAQIDRHTALAALGHEVVGVWADSAEDAADQAEALVRSWLGANDNRPAAAQEARGAAA